MIAVANLISGCCWSVAQQAITTNIGKRTRTLRAPVFLTPGNEALTSALPTALRPGGGEGYVATLNLPRQVGEVGVMVNL